MLLALLVIDVPLLFAALAVALAVSLRVGAWRRPVLCTAASGA